MRTYKIDISENAERDLFEIGFYIAKELAAPKAAKRILAELQKSINSLEQMPKRHPLIDSKRYALKGIRVFVMERYNLYYTVVDSSNTVYINRVMHQSRDNEEYLVDDFL